MPPTYGSPPTISRSMGGVSPRRMPMSPTPWSSSPGNPTPRARDSKDFQMRGAKRDFATEPMSRPSSIPFEVPPTLSASGADQGLGLMDVPDLCMSTVGTEALSVSWTGSSGLVSTASDSDYSTTPPPDTSHSLRSAARFSGGEEWVAPLGPQLIARGMQSPGTSGGHYPSPFPYDASPPLAFSSVYEGQQSSLLPRCNDSLYGSPDPGAVPRGLPTQMAVSQCSDTLVTLPAAPPSVLTMASPGSCQMQPEMALGLLATHDFWPVPLSQEAVRDMPRYLDLYWTKVHPNYPIIHRATFESAEGPDVEHLDMLRCAMAAVATQFLGDREVRIYGSQLHAHASKLTRVVMSMQTSNWSLPAMQAVLLCEYYSRFRGGSKEAHRPSLPFHKLCHMMTRQETWEAMTGTSDDTMQGWREWVRVESCRRLLAACFLLSVHGTWYYEQPFGADFGLDSFSPLMLSVPLSANTTQAWEAESAESWAALDKAAIRMQTVGDALQQKQTLMAEGIDLMPPFDASLLLAAHALQLPRRQQHTEMEALEDVSGIDCDSLPIARLFPHSEGAHVYVALHYTPLHYLLSVSGDSWVFNRKIALASCFVEHQKKLKKWRGSSSAAVATVFAAKALKLFLDLKVGGDGNIRPARGGPWRDISDFWALYVCTLICWAFGHGGKQCVDVESSSSLSTRAAAARWIIETAEMQPGQLKSMGSRAESQWVVGLVRGVLERDCLGRRSILYADAVGVLSKLEESDGLERF